MTVRVSVIGCGAAALRIHLPALRATDATVSCFASRTLGSAEQAAAAWGSGDVTDDWQKAVERDDVDAVVVCAPNVLHADMTVAAARAGKHVLVEKPMATTLADADRMIEAARAAGVLLVPAQNARFAPAIVAARAAIAEGLLGEITGFEASLGNAGPLAWSPTATWFLDPAQSGGGALLDLGIHVADFLRAVLAEEMTDVSAQTDGQTVERSASATLTTASGATGTMRVSWDLATAEARLVVRGSAATLEADVSSGARVLVPGTAARDLPLGPPQPEPTAGFIRACAGGSAPAVTAHDGRAALAIVRAAAASARLGRPVMVGEE